MPEKKNALAELADDFAMYRDFHKDDDRANGGILTKVQRIVAELAKVEDVTEVHNLEPVQVPNSWQCHDVVVKCRAIAEEGAI